MTAEQTLQIEGFRAHLDAAGVLLTPNSGPQFRALVEDVSMLPEPFETARQQTPIYATVTAIAADVTAPRSITYLTDENNRRMRVVMVRPVQDPAFVEWTVEVAR